MLTNAQINILTKMKAGLEVRREVCPPYNYKEYAGNYRILNRYMMDKLADAGVIELTKHPDGISASFVTLTDFGKQLLFKHEIEIELSISKAEMYYIEQIKSGRLDYTPNQAVLKSMFDKGIIDNIGKLTELGKTINIE